MLNVAHCALGTGITLSRIRLFGGACHGSACSRIAGARRSAAGALQIGLNRGTNARFTATQPRPRRSGLSFAQQWRVLATVSSAWTFTSLTALRAALVQFASSGPRHCLGRALQACRASSGRSAFCCSERCRPGRLVPSTAIRCTWPTTLRSALHADAASPASIRPLVHVFGERRSQTLPERPAMLACLLVRDRLRRTGAAGLPCRLALPACHRWPRRLRCTLSFAKLPTSVACGT